MTCLKWGSRNMNSSGEEECFCVKLSKRPLLRAYQATALMPNVTSGTSGNDGTRRDKSNLVHITWSKSTVALVQRVTIWKMLIEDFDLFNYEFQCKTTRNSKINFAITSRHRLTVAKAWITKMNTGFLGLIAFDYSENSVSEICTFRIRNKWSQDRQLDNLRILVSGNSYTLFLSSFFHRR